MQPLNKTLRSQLEKAIKDARDIAEEAARSSLEQLCVTVMDPDTHLSEEERELRRRLRNHAKQLGDDRILSGEQSIERLVEEVAYEHWHRMLFARFLADNNLLMYPDPVAPVPITLDECEELAADEGATNGWELAARFASRMLPQIFRTDSPVFEIVLAKNYQLPLERLLAELPVDVFTASDSLGWVYQYWQSKKKNTVNESEVKIGARELPAVTQIFTEPYMVSFLLDNALGAWWAANILSEDDWNNSQSEVELRKKASIPGVPLEYLRFVKKGNRTWTPAAGRFDAWPKSLSELKTLDPCCGSGHFLAATTMMLVPMRMKMENLTAREAVDKVLSENIHGLEIDKRCVELAAFALALTAWKYPDAGGYRPLPELHIACSGLSVSVAKQEWKQLVAGQRNMTIVMDWMHDVFRDASVLGSLINPAKSNVVQIVPLDELSLFLQQALSLEQSDEKKESAIVAYGLAKAANLLVCKYNLVITNVPYLARGKQNDTMREFCEINHPVAKNDLATVFLERCLDFCTRGGTVSVVLPQNWLFLTSYKKFREKLLINDRWHLLARLGAGAFDTISGEIVKAILFSISNDEVTEHTREVKSSYIPEKLICGFDVSQIRSSTDKALGLLASYNFMIKQDEQLMNPDSRIMFDALSTDDLLSEYAEYGKGSTTGDAPRFIQFFWERESIDDKCIFWLDSPIAGVPWSGRSEICKVSLDDYDLNSQLVQRLLVNCANPKQPIHPFYTSIDRLQVVC